MGSWHEWLARDDAPQTAAHYRPYLLILSRTRADCHDRAESGGAVIRPSGPRGGSLWAHKPETGFRKGQPPSTPRSRKGVLPRRSPRTPRRTEESYKARQIASRCSRCSRWLSSEQRTILSHRDHRETRLIPSDIRGQPKFRSKPRCNRVAFR